MDDHKRMPSGYEKSPDYGGRDPEPWEHVLAWAIIIGLAALGLWATLTF